MQILLVIHAPLREGKGTERFIVSLANYLVENGHDVTVLENSTPQLEQSEYAPFLFERKFKLISTPFIRRRFYLSIDNKCINFVPDCVYVSTFNAVPLIPLLKSRIIYGAHGVFPNTVKFRNIKEKLKFKLKSIAFKQVVVSKWRKSTNKISFLVLTQAQRNWLTKVTGNQFSISTLPVFIKCEGFDAPHFKPETNSFKILYFGSLSPEKGFDTFMSLYTMINSKYRNLGNTISFYVAGDGPMRNVASKESVIGKNFKYLGNLSDADKFKLFHESDLLIYTSTLDIE